MGPVDYMNMLVPLLFMLHYQLRGEKSKGNSPVIVHVTESDCVTFSPG